MMSRKKGLDEKPTLLFKICFFWILQSDYFIDVDMLAVKVEPL